jgi:hypothetical protein
VPGIHVLAAPKQGGRDKARPWLKGRFKLDVIARSEADEANQTLVVCGSGLLRLRSQ